MEPLTLYLLSWLGWIIIIGVLILNSRSWTDGVLVVIILQALLLINFWRDGYGYYAVAGISSLYFCFAIFGAITSLLANEEK